ncbi:Cytosolic Fe-S cluster assembly factor NAR1 [Fulvia fulva]|uniref:Nuclear architecture-related protein 1 n=1 Tax=Passalora fulva TaxID=5499 RepID=A0A9Q8P3X6_PASFU|nr:Cytosolic Fe-S cluster assembly factor NAR1 [Fulvia fulva]KAK4634886.1 Cytosolic Fe-S cluster assembly factor NAR1 [Fulvia fulva]KAK4637489.1 Cytosolic Fe-S cluster assembly factor NAR1 [Fulvia fulva]UJO12388.1 Cytosolic Fe-S cluster assembly factor NAR1 [Fulvia fulva]WPV10146.1 Cytosolic Fe-S cluster assembly factor NAR1 [Fulvia fulva]WPV25321.1 Cytosolic Fe-S cluster assembly factor NAR1 [Fulvia fulva]
MSAILSVDDLNDFISPGVACIKPVETLPKQQPADDSNAYEVTTEEKVDSGTIAPPAQISLTDCLACAGCVTSAEAVLVSLQSHGEVLDTLDQFPDLKIEADVTKSNDGIYADHRLFVASVSPQSRASIAATYNVTEREAGYMIAQLLSGPAGLRSGGQHGSGFTWVVDTNVLREATLVAAADEVEQSNIAPIGGTTEAQKKPIITSACPGWICYAEKTHPHILPHLSKLKSPQAVTGVLLKSVLANKYGIPPQNVWHLSVMPCFDKKLEAARSELTSHTWHGQEGDAVRDVDCVITARELLMLAESRDISFPRLPKQPLSKDVAPDFPEPTINEFLFSRQRGQKRERGDETNTIGSSGGYLWHILKTKQAQHIGSQVMSQRGRNNDVSEYSVVDADGRAVFKAARYYGFRNIQNLVRRLKPAKASRMPGASRKVGSSRRPGAATGGNESEYSYVEVMACPGGCTNGGGQIKVGDVATLRQIGGTGIENGSEEQEVMPAQREWLAKVDEAYWSAESDDLPDSDADGDIDMERSPARDSVISGDGDANADVVDGIDRRRVKQFLGHWSDVTGISLDTLMTTTYRIVESDVGKDKPGGDVDRVNALAAAAGGGW